MNPGQDAADRLIADGNRAEEAGRLREACELYRRAVGAAPRHARAHLNLGIALEALGDVDGAIDAYHVAMGIDPADPYARYNLGKLFFSRGALPRADQLLKEAIRLRPDFAEARSMLAGVLQAQGQPADAAAEFAAALKLRPDDFGTLLRYADLLYRIGRLDEAQAALVRATAIRPDDAEASHALATVLMARGRPREAEPHLRAVLRHRPDSLEARAALSHVLEAHGDLSEAAMQLEQVVRQRPDWADALYNYGCMLKKLMRLTEAENALRRALAAEPAHARAYQVLGGVLLGQCRMDEALALYRTARARCPDDFELESAELFALNASGDISDDVLFAKHAAFGRRIEKTYLSRFEPFPNVRDPERRLRIGYLSGDFCYHVVTLFLLPVLERRDRSAVEVYCYSTGGRSDEFTRKLAAHADVWREAAGLTENQLADAIHGDEIDILVDLAGHSGAPQLRVLAQRPAPVQGTWLGYLNTTGLTRIQYRISDRFADPPGVADRYHTETLVRLPHSQWCYRPFMSVEGAKTPPCLRNGYLTLGSFNQALKISRAARSLWAELLERLPESRLVIMGIGTRRAEEDLLADLAGVTGGRRRITVRPYVSLEDYFRSFDDVDIALDTLPYSGGTTTCDALWMGVPVLTAPGSRSCSRSTASLLTSVGLTEWIVPSTGDYVRRAVEFAGKRERLAELRASLRARMQASPLMDEERFARDLEGAYRRMWRHWCGRC